MRVLASWSQPSVLPANELVPSIDLRDRLAERGPVHDEDRERRPQKRREHAEDSVRTKMRRHEARHDRDTAACRA